MQPSPRWHLVRRSARLSAASPPSNAAACRAARNSHPQLGSCTHTDLSHRSAARGELRTLTINRGFLDSRQPGCRWNAKGCKACHLRSSKWSELVAGPVINWFLSADSKYMYYTTGGAEPKAFRIRLVDRTVEFITDLK